MTTSLFEPVRIGSIEAKNRVFMAPLTRARATKDHVPTPIMAEYYAQRASAGLIISEATGISREGLGWPYAPGIWSQEQVEAWKPIVEAVHQKGGKIVCQLWHMGRAVHSNVTGQQPVAPSPTTYPFRVYTYAGKLPAEAARELTREDIRRITREYEAAARNAIAAGFDGVQIHGANGYLIDEFLRDSENRRTDEYGGSIANRVRLLDEVTAAVVGAIGAERTGVRLSPNGDTQGVVDSDPEPLFTAAAEALNKHGVAWLELRELTPDSTFGKGTDQPLVHNAVRKVFRGKLVLNQEYTRARADAVLSEGAADAVAFGRPFISNPRLVEQLRADTPLAANRNHAIRWWYSQGPEGYTDLEVLSKI